MSLKALFAPSDMTEGTPWKKILNFTIPMLIGNIAQQLYNTADSVVVGNYVGDNALAAVGSANPIYMLLLVLFMGVSVGAGVMVSQYYGAKRREELSKSIGTSITLTAIVSLIIMVVGTIVTKPLLRLLSTPESIIDWCADYLMILIIGIAGTSYYNIFSGILRGLGDSVSALIYLLIACFLNIFLDILFVAVFHLGVPGVALATVIAQLLSAVLAFLKLRKMSNVFDLKARFLKLDKVYVKMLVRLGLPSGITQAIFSMAMITVQSLTNSFGEMVIAANVIIMRVDGFAMMPNFSFGTALTTFAGQNVGAGKYDRVAEGTKQGTLIATITSAVITGLIIIFGKYLMGIFTKTEELVTLSNNMMRILAVGYIGMSITQCLSGVMRGAGDTMTPMWISLITTVGIRVPLAYGLVALTRTAERPQGAYQSLWISMLASWIIGAVLTVILYMKGNWKKKALSGTNQARPAQDDSREENPEEAV
ncbi:MAG: MATE family efflux transporter [Firmicutes bacterium]|nr:MATE family efflux transporter [Bacillota bacterium]